MSTNFKVNFKRYNGNLHVRPRGDLDGSAAHFLIRLLKEKYNGNEEVVIDTRNMRTVQPFGSSTFQGRIHQCGIPLDRLSYTGKNGAELAPDNGKVIAETGTPKGRYCGNCKNCPCSRKKTASTTNPLGH
jgi:hypothetical protein